VNRKARDYLQEHYDLLEWRAKKEVELKKELELLEKGELRPPVGLMRINGFSVTTWFIIFLIATIMMLVTEEFTKEWFHY